MLLDAQLNFVAPGSPLSLVAGAGVAIPSPGIIDLLGLGVGVAPTERIIGLPQSGVFGADAGIGRPKPQVQVNIGTALVAVASSTMNVAFQGAPDTGVGGGYQPGAWTSIVNQDGLTIAELAALSVVFRMDWPAALPANLNARFFRLLFTPTAAYTAGSIGSATVTMGRDDQANKYATKNFTV